MMRSMAAAVAAALALSSAVCVRAQLTELNLFEIIALPQYRNEFTILNSMIDKWFDGGADASPAKARVLWRVTCMPQSIFLM